MAKKQTAEFEVAVRFFQQEEVPAGTILELEVDDEGNLAESVPGLIRDRVRKLAKLASDAPEMTAKGAKGKAVEILTEAKAQAADIVAKANEEATQVKAQAEQDAIAVVAAAHEEAARIVEAAKV